jgi:hypothetical protein
MELLRGEDLANYGTRVGPLGPAQVLDIFRQLCHGLGAAHAAGLVHRDLKPENVFLAASRHVGVPYTVKLLDFGIAKVVQETRRNVTEAVGTPMWMSPEQTEAGHSITPAADVWGLGLIAFRLRAGADTAHPVACVFFRAQRARGQGAGLLAGTGADIDDQVRAHHARIQQRMAFARPGFTRHAQQPAIGGALVFHGHVVGHAAAGLAQFEREFLGDEHAIALGAPVVLDETHLAFAGHHALPVFLIGLGRAGHHQQQRQDQTLMHKQLFSRWVGPIHFVQQNMRAPP